MDLEKLTYQGKKFYRDPYGNNWNPGDTQTVTAEQAGKLLRHPEFERPKDGSKKAKDATDTVDASKVKADEDAKTEEAKRAEKAEADRLAQVAKEEADARKRIKEQERAKEQEDEAKENMLLLVESMDKGALEEYALKYEVNLDKRLGVAKLRAEVSNLIEQFGAR